MGRKQNRCSKKQREVRRTEHANTFNSAYSMGFESGYNQAVIDFEKGDIDVQKIRIPRKTM